MNTERKTAGPEQAPPACPGLVSGVHVQVALEGMSSCRGLFIGMEAGQYLLVKLPPLIDIWKKLYKKNHVIIRYVHGGNIYGFRTTLIGLIRETVRLFVFAYPEMVESMNLRKEERFPCMLPVILTDAVRQSDEERQGMISDLSAGGCSCEVAAPVAGHLQGAKIGDRLRLVFRLQEDMPPLAVEAELRMLQKDQNRLRLGLRFLIDPTDSSQDDTAGAIRLFLAGFKKRYDFSSRGSAF